MANTYLMMHQDNSMGKKDFFQQRTVKQRKNDFELLAHIILTIDYVFKFKTQKYKIFKILA